MVRYGGSYTVVSDFGKISKERKWGRDTGCEMLRADIFCVLGANCDYVLSDSSRQDIDNLDEAYRVDTARARPGSAAPFAANTTDATEAKPLSKEMTRLVQNYHPSLHAYISAVPMTRSQHLLGEVLEQCQRPAQLSF